MIVVDASALVEALIPNGAHSEWARERLSGDPAWCAPDSLIAEAFAAVRGLQLGGKLTSEAADEAFDALSAVFVDLVPTQRLVPSCVS